MMHMKRCWMRHIAARSAIVSLGFYFVAAIAAIALTVPTVAAQDKGEAEAFVPIRTTYGVSFGTSAGFLNFTTDQFFSENTGLRFLGGYLPTGDGAYGLGLQLGPIFKLKEKPGSWTSLGVALGYSKIENGDAFIFYDGSYVYLAPAFGYHDRSLFLEAGMGFQLGGDGDVILLLNGGFNFKTIRRWP